MLGSELSRKLPVDEQNLLKETFKKLDTDADGYVEYNIIINVNFVFTNSWVQGSNPHSYYVRPSVATREPSRLRFMLSCYNTESLTCDHSG
jgi:hypothetical protein